MKNTDLENMLSSTRAINGALETFVSILEEMEREGVPTDSTVKLIDESLVEDIIDLVNFLHFSSIAFSKQRCDQIERIKGALKNA